MNLTLCSVKGITLETSALMSLHDEKFTLVTLFHDKFWCDNNNFKQLLLSDIEQNIMISETDKSQHFVITLFDNCFIIQSLFF